MRKIWIGLLVWAAVGMAAGATNVVIRSFDSSGRVVFDEVANATGYRVEWASMAGGAWTNTWDALNGIPSVGLGTVTAAVPLLYRVVATVTSAPPPSGMVLIPAGSFVMGNATNVFPAGEGYSGELPQHTVYVSAFYMGQYEVTKAEWDEVYAWAIANGYGFDYAGSGKAANHPVQTIDWYDVVKWCNARSQKEGLTPCYTVGGSVYTNGQSAPDCNWTVAGYRLPTEAEWEKAARGGAANMRFPWADTNIIDHSRANYYSYWSGGVPYYTYDKGYEGYDPAYTNGGYPYTSPVGAFAPNGYGLYDMAGNVWEWCWDWYDGSYYATSPGADPRGPVTGSRRVLRGGGWDYDAYDVRCAFRSDYWPVNGSYDLGFRPARSVGP